MQAETLQEKQTLLRKEIIEAGIDAEAFMEFMGSVKDQGENIDLQSWTKQQLKNVIVSFKEQINKNRQELTNSRITSVKKTKIFQPIKKEKVKYEGTSLWDYEINEQQQCAKSQTLFKFQPNNQPLIKVEKWEIKSVGGFIFGIGSRNQLDLTITTNFTPNRVIRKGEDCDWLKSILTGRHPGCYVPPLQMEREFSSDDKKGINARVAQIESFLNTLLIYPVFHTSYHFKQFLDQPNYKKFTQYKTRQSAFAQEKDIDCIQNVNGKFNVEITEKINKKIKISSQITSDINRLYGEFNTCFSKIIMDMSNISKSVKGLADLTAKITQKYSQVQSLFKLQNQMKSPTMLLSLYNTINVVGRNIKRHAQALNQFNQSYIKNISKDWNQFVLFDKRQQNQMRNYLSVKENLIRKKQKYVSDISKWELPESQYMALVKKGGKLSKQQSFQKMFPSENENENRLRIWLSFYNQNYLNSFQQFILQQQKDLFSKFLIYSGEYMASNVQVKSSYNSFYEIYVQ